MYWPVAIVVPLALAACLNLFNQGTMQFSPMPLAAARVSAELARTVSYGFVGVDTAVTGVALHTPDLPAQTL
jgi:hypothetical protein